MNAPASPIPHLEIAEQSLLKPHGLAPHQLERVFEPFYRGPGQEAASGVGLGLTIAREIVRSHGGELSAASAPGRGATFTFTLPVAGGDGR